MFENNNFEQLTWYNGAIQSWFHISSIFRITRSAEHAKSCLFELPTVYYSWTRKSAAGYVKTLSILLQTKYRTTHNTDQNLVACTLAINIISQLVLKVTIILLSNSKENLGGVRMAGIQFPWESSVDHSSYYAAGTRDLLPALSRLWVWR